MIFNAKLALLVTASVLSCVSISFSSSSAFAQEAKPGSDVAAVSKAGTAIFEGHVFQYHVTDRGVRTSGQIFPKPAILTSEHNYVLAYNPKNDLSHEQVVKLVDVIRAEASAKCKELSDAEFSDFKKSDASDEIKKSAGQMTEFIGASSAQRALNPQLNPGVFVCNVIVKVQIN